MKSPCLTLALSLFLFACSSKEPKNSSKDIPEKKDTTAAVQDTTFKATVFTDVEGITVPPYGLDTVQALLKKVRFEEDTLGGDDGTEALDEKTYNSLSFKQKFTYHMIHPESYSQNCDGLPVRTDEANRIYGHLTDVFGEYDWSERQLNFFKNNRDLVEQLMKPLIEKGNMIGGNFKEAIVEMNAKELIPYLIDFYNKEKKDHYILTILMLLMKKNEYPEFINSISNSKLYGQPENEYSAYLVYNKANEDLIIKRAMNFYNGLQAK